MVYLVYCDNTGKKGKKVLGKSLLIFPILF